MSAQKSILYTSFGRAAVKDSGGTGLPLLMLHGSGSSKSVFKQQFESPLADIHRLIAIDLPGHGASERSVNPKKDYTITAISDFMAEALALLGVESAFVFGWSLGGHIAVQMMHDHPDMISGVMLSGTPPIPRGNISIFRAFHTRLDSLLGAKPSLSQKEAGKFATLCYGDDYTPTLVDDLLQSDGKMRSGVKRSLIRGEGGPDQRQILAHSDLPVGVVNGGKDPFVRLSYIENATYGNLWENTCHVIANAGHTPFLNASNTFNTLLHRFITDVALRQKDEPKSDEKVIEVAEEVALARSA